MNQQRAILAGGCFWGMQDLIRKMPGVIGTRVGYTGGTLKNPTYEDTHAPDNRHAEAIEITFDADKLSYEQLLQFFFKIHDPTTVNRQGNDRGAAYRSAIFHLDNAQKSAAESLIAQMNASRKWPGPIVTELAPAGEFYEAEREHQDYLERYPEGYTCHYIRPDWIL